MSVHIRPANLTQERTVLVDLFRQFLSPELDDRRFAWLYLNSPQGTGRAWFACDREGGTVIGAAAAFPRHLSIAGRLQRSWVLGDFCLNPKFRSLGPALALQRACLRFSCGTPGEFCYDLPSQSMMAIYARIGVPEAGRLVRWVKLLSVTRRIRSLVPSTAVAKAIGAPVNFVLCQRGEAKTRNSVTRLALHEGRCTSEFTELNSQVCNNPGAFTARSAEYLNWRYLDHPAVKYRILAARRAGVLVGYAVFGQEGSRVVVADICSMGEPCLVQLLLTGVSHQARQCGAEALSLTAADSHPWSGIFRRAGFYSRESSPLVTCQQDSAGELHSRRITQWHFMNGERES